MFLRNLPLQLLLTVVLAVLFGSWLPLPVSNVLYTLGCAFKDMLMLFIPLVVCGYLMASIVSFDKKSLILIAGVVCLTSLSSFVTSVFAYGFSKTILSLVTVTALPLATDLPPSDELVLLWQIPFTSPFTPTVAIFTALLLGFLAVFANVKALKTLANSVRDGTTHVLKTYLIPLLPLYVLAVVLKIQSEGSVRLLFAGYGKIFLLLYAFVLLFALGAFWLLAGRHIKQTAAYLKTFWSTTVTAFTTMSGIASMPFLVEATEEATGSKDYARFTIPLTINIHTLGDGLVIPITSLTLLYMQDGVLPSFATFLPFAGAYTLARFFNACVPGGGVLIMAPFAEKYLGLSNELVGFLTTLYILQDPLITTTNAVGNALFALAAKPLVMLGLKSTKPPGGPRKIMPASRKVL